MATPQTGGAAPQTGSNRISIITKSEIRYEGIMYHINSQDQSITLCQVKSFGTEGRRPNDEIAPSPQIHDYIIFRGTDIKDLKVLDGSQAPTQPDASAGTAQGQNQKPQQQNQPAPKKDAEEIKMAKGATDFDFSDMQQKFQQYTSEHKIEKEGPKSTYVKNNFFDEISTSTAERDPLLDRNTQKQIDQETFGAKYVDNAIHRGRGGGYRRGGRGGRGGYNRGGGYRGGRGGYNNNRGGNRYYGGNQQGRGYGNRYDNDDQGYGQGEGRRYSRGGYQGGYGGYGGGRGGRGNYGGYGGGRDNYGGYGGGQRNYEGGYDGSRGGQRDEGQGGEQGGYRGGYRGGQGGEQGGYRGGQGGEQGGYRGGQGGYQGGHGGYQGGRGGYQGGRGGYQGGQGGYQGGYQGGPRYQKTYEPVTGGESQ